ncbi:hypothetical protein LR013_03010 [candidate division NPL-UPA2 bacterium]|nr:hypothetical protein [candidate division NPL-UPA2 bacterium]
MLVIGEKINGMYRAAGKSIQEKDKEIIEELARAQVEASADYLDVNYRKK